MTHTEAIIRIVQSRTCHTYLEIGIQNPANNFDRIPCGFKVGVDPATNAPNVLRMTSDRFFEFNRTQFDVIFIDGDHTYDQSKKDMHNALRAVKPGGCILVHDCNPVSKEMATPKQARVGTPWCGEVYRSFSEFIAPFRDQAYCIDVLQGLGVVEVGQAPDLSRSEESMSWDVFVADRKKWINLISVDDWLKGNQT